MASRTLIALDEDDLAVISAHLQDARVRIADIIWRPQEKRLVIGMERPDWDQALDGAEPTVHRASALRFDRVLSARSRHVDCSDPEALLDLIGVEFAEVHPPGGVVTLLFSARRAMQIDVECLECELVDLA